MVIKSILLLSAFLATLIVPIVIFSTQKKEPDPEGDDDKEDPGTHFMRG
jgi:hypothetical protein|tara:strand:- start:362 stop:508 length:147 start_codon:yes stop_codon:yes gene_type:complete